MKKLCFEFIVKITLEFANRSCENISSTYCSAVALQLWPLRLPSYLSSLDAPAGSSEHQHHSCTIPMNGDEGSLSTRQCQQPDLRFCFSFTCMLTGLWNWSEAPIQTVWPDFFKTLILSLHFPFVLHGLTTGFSNLFHPQKLLAQLDPTVY